MGSVGPTGICRPVGRAWNGRTPQGETAVEGTYFYLLELRLLSGTGPEKTSTDQAVSPFCAKYHQDLSALTSGVGSFGPALAGNQQLSPEP